MTSNTFKVDQELSFVLHSIPWRETSQIIDVFSQDRGRVPLVAKGSKRPRSPIRGLLQPFQPLRLSWSGNNELRTLRNAEWVGGIPQLSGVAIYCGFYLNELLVRLLPRDDPHPILFKRYFDTIQQLAYSSNGFEPLLRSFELCLLTEIGFAPSLLIDGQTQLPIKMDSYYIFDIDKGMIQTFKNLENRVQFSGNTLINISNNDFSDTQTLQESKYLMRLLLNQCLGDKDLQSRRVLQELPLL